MRQLVSSVMLRDVMNQACDVFIKKEERFNTLPRGKVFPYTCMSYFISFLPGMDS